MDFPVIALLRVSRLSGEPLARRVGTLGRAGMSRNGRYRTLFCAKSILAAGTRQGTTESDLARFLNPFGRAILKSLETHL